MFFFRRIYMCLHYWCSQQCVCISVQSVCVHFTKNDISNDFSEQNIGTFSETSTKSCVSDAVQYGRGKGSYCHSLQCKDVYRLLQGFNPYPANVENRASS
jgi:hypothetical protein